MQQAQLSSELSSWNDALDCAVASVALDANDVILIVGSANDVRNLFVAIGTASNRTFTKVTTSSNTDVTAGLSRLERSPKFWAVGTSYKDAHLTRRAHTKIELFLKQPVQPVDNFTTDPDLLRASANTTNRKFMLLPGIVKIILVLPHGCSEPPPLTIHRSSLSPTTTNVPLFAKSICRAYDGLSAAHRPQPDEWTRYIAHGLAHQVRWDFGVTISALELESSWVRRKVAGMAQSERSGAQGNGERYLPRPNVNSELERLLMRPQRIQTGTMDTASLTPEQAEVIILCVTDGGGVTMGIPGLSSAFAMVRQAVASEPTEGQIVKASEVLKSIQAHQEGGKVRRPRWCQALAIMWVLFSLALSIAVGAANLAGRDNWFERLTDSVSSATVLLVGIFGLVKLTSEDDNAIRNSLRGFSILRNVKDVRKYFKWKMRDVPFELALAAADRPLLWLADGNTSYLQHTPLGSIACVGGVRSKDLLPLGMVCGKTMMLDYRLGRGFVVSGRGVGQICIQNRLQVTDIKTGVELGVEDSLLV